jgi:hypothetical protein
MPSHALTVQVERRIYLISGKKVMLDHDLAELYGVDTGALNRAVKRNGDRFPGDLMFQLGGDEWERLRCQIGISNKGTGVSHSALRFQSGTSKSRRGGRRYLPYAFTEQASRCYPACCAAPARFRSISPSCVHSCACVRCFFAMPISRANWAHWKRNTTRSSRLFRCDSRVNDSAGKAKTPDWVPFL